MALEESGFPLCFLIERCCHDGELMPRDLRQSRLSAFPPAWRVACEAAIAAAPVEDADELFFFVYWSVGLERVRRRAEGGACDADCSGLVVSHGVPSQQFDFFMVAPVDNDGYAWPVVPAFRFFRNEGR